MAAKDLLGLSPVALLQIYLRSRVIRIVKLPQAPVFPGEGEKNSDVRIVSEIEIGQMLDHARGKLQEKASRLREGILTAQPTEYDRCGPGACNYADLCRYREKWGTR
jgi:ATP-dependent helicase/DNAse subunit B